MNKNKVFARQLDLVKPSELEFPIAVIGAGGIGSWTTLALAKMGCSNITVFDFDKVEDRNVPSQIYSHSDIGNPKVNALQKIVEQMTGTYINFQADYFQKVKLDSFKMVIVAVDSLEQRTHIWQKLTEGNKPHFDCLVDARMGGELMKLYIVSPLSEYSVSKYMKSLNPNVPVHDEPCTARSIVYNTFVCGGLIANIVKKYAKKESVNSGLLFDLATMQLL